MASSTTRGGNVTAPARSSTSRSRRTDPNLPDYGPAIIVVNDAGEEIMTNGGKEYGHTSRKHGYDHFRCTECVQLARESGLTQDRIRTRIETFKVSGLDTDDPRLRSDISGTHHYCITGYTRKKPRATTDAIDRMTKRRRPDYGEDATEPDTFGQAERMEDGSYVYRHEKRASTLRYKEDGKMSAEIHGAKDVYCVGCSELDTLYHCRALILRGNFVLFDPAQGDGDNVHICMDEADEKKHVQQPMGSHSTLQEPPDGAHSPAQTEQQGLNQLADDILDAPLDDADALLNAILAQADTTKMKSESLPNSVQPADSSLLTHSSPIVRPAAVSRSSAAGRRTTSAARYNNDVITLGESDDEDAPASAALSARVKLEPLGVSNVQAASAEFVQTPVPSPTPARTSTAASAVPASDVKPPCAIPAQRPSGVPLAYKDSKVFGKALFVNEGSQTFVVYKQGLNGVHHKFKQLWTSTETLEGETFEVGTYECYDCALFLAKEGSTAAIGQVTVVNGYFIDSHPRLPERIRHCCKPTPDRR